MTQEPKGVKVWVSVQVKGKVVELRLGTYTLAMLHCAFLGRGMYSGDPGVVRVLELALGYTGEVENELRIKSRFGDQAFRDLLWEWIAAQLEEVSCV